MEKPQNQTDRLIKDINEYNLHVGSLQVHVWSELKKLNSDREFIHSHAERIKHNKLTKLEEVGYVLEIISEINNNKSAELNKRIEDLEKSKLGLEKYSKKLRTEINFTNELLEQQERENEELLQQLKQQGISGKVPQQKELLELKEQTIQRLTVSLANARREVESAYKARSPTPSREAGTNNITQKIPQISIEATEHHSNGQSTAKIRAEDLRDKVRSILCNAKKTVNRGYTEETKRRKREELENYREQFHKLSDNQDSCRSEFDALWKEAINALQKATTIPALLGEYTINSNMSNIADLLKTISHIVPIFYGTPGPELSTEARKFIEGCVLAKDNLGINGDIPLLIKCIKTRLCGAAYTYLSNKDFTTIESLCEVIKNKYLRHKTLTELQEEIVNSKQRQGEAAFEFGERIESLLLEARNLISSQWTNTVEQKSIIEHCNQAAVRSFIRGLQDHRLAARLIGCENETLSTVLRIVGSAQNLLGPPPISSSIFPVKVEQPLEAVVRDLIEEVRLLSLKQNSQLPPDNDRRTRNHFSDHMNRSFPRNSYCDFCKKIGHSHNDCNNRRKEYCNQCRQVGHTDRNCRRTSQNQNQNRSMNQTIHNYNQHTQRRRLVCFKCNKEGHYSFDCARNDSARRLNNRNNYTPTNIRSKDYFQNNQGNSNGTSLE